MEEKQTEVKKEFFDKKKIKVAVKNTKKLFVNKDFNVFKTLWTSLITPMKFYNEDKDKMEEATNAFAFISVMSFLAALFSVLFAFIKAIFNTESCSFGYCVKVSFFDRLASINWWSLIWQNFLFPIVIVLGLTGIFYLGILVAKKKMNYKRMAVFTAVAYLPYLLSSVLISPFFGSIFPYTQISFIINSTALVYTILLFFTFVRYESNFKDKTDAFMYYCLACSSVVVLIIYEIINKYLFSIFTSIL